MEKYFSFFIPSGSRVLELGCGTGELLNALNPSYGVGVDFSEKMIDLAKKSFPDLHFFVGDVKQFSIDGQFDYIIMSDLLSSLTDVQKTISTLHRISSPQTRIIISNYNYLWEPILRFGELFGMKAKQPLMNWLSSKDIENLLSLEGYEIIKEERKILFPKYIPRLSTLINCLIANLPLIQKLCLVNFLIIRDNKLTETEHSVSIIIPARNEKENIENAILRTPAFGKSQEFIFVEGGSKDVTFEEILRVKEKYAGYQITALKQSGTGKGNAVREAFEKATGDVLMILDADLTMPPEDLPKYYEALKRNRCEFVNGCRLVYPMKEQAMRVLNIIANRLFGIIFTFLLGQHVKDTLCGTKVLYKKDYELIKKNRGYFGDFDPFGDFDLLFGASKLNLKIVEMPIRYKDREYGETQISRFSHGWLLLKMSCFAAKKIKFI